MRPNVVDLFRVAIFTYVAGVASLTCRAEEPPKPGVDALMKMPGETFRGPLPPLTEGETKLAAALKADVAKLAGLGEHNVANYAKLAEAAAWAEKSLAAAGYKVERQTYTVKGRECHNFIAEIPGGARAKEIVIVGAHYDSAPGAPGANDNGSGVAGVLALARSLAGQKPERTLRFVLFTNEEPPYFQTDDMGSLVYAKACAAKKENIVAMLSLETIGYYSEEKGSQKYPLPFALFYPSQGNFIGFIGDVKSGPLVVECVKSFRTHTKFPSEGAALPAHITGVGWSDHWSFWQYDYPALMVTDTAPFRYPHYHLKSDTPDKLDYDRMARVVAGVERVVVELASPGARK